MKKYSALSQYLSGLKTDIVQLTFSQIEKIIDGRLPLSATRQKAWWANEKNGTHRWAHLWQAAGWVKEEVDFDKKT